MPASQTSLPIARIAQHSSTQATGVSSESGFATTTA